MSKKKMTAFAIVFGILVLLCDFFTKSWTVNHIPHMRAHHYPYNGIAIFQDFFGIEFSWVHATNRGAAWGILADFQLYLILLRFFLIFALLIYLIFFNTHKNWIIPLSLIAFGAIGNILDFFLYGHVIDMFHFVIFGMDFPVFNIADSAICLGIFSLLIISWGDKE